MKKTGFFLLVTALFIVAGCSQDSVTDLTSEGALSSVELAKRGDNNHPPRMHTYEVTVENLTSGQPFTPPTLTTHLKGVSLFTVGEPASFELKEIAENGNLDPMLSSLGASDDVREVVVATAGDPPPIMPGQSVTATINTYRGARFLSFASMFVCTNDGFTGLDTVPLPTTTGAEIELYTNGYDAGTEINTEDFADIVPPCQGLVGIMSDDEGTGASNPALAENGVVHHHAGIQGGDDLQSDPHGWDDPVARVTIRKIQ